MVPATAALMIVGPAKYDEKETRRWPRGRSLTAREAVEGVLASEHADVLRESVAVMVREIMELEVSSSLAPSTASVRLGVGWRSATGIVSGGGTRGSGRSSSRSRS
jgi:hypothetical protein